MISIVLYKINPLITVEEMDEADEELRQTLKKLWPLKAKKNVIDLAVPPNSG